MSMFAEVSLTFGSLLAWVAVGLIPGFLAARVHRGGRFGTAGDTALAVAGVAAAVTGALLFGLFGSEPLAGLGLGGPVVGVAAALLSATVVVALVCAVVPRPDPATGGAYVAGPAVPAAAL